MTFESVGQRLEAAVQRFGTRVALHELRGGITHVTTYAQVGRRLAEHAAWLDDAGVGRGQPVLVRAAPGQRLEAMLGELAVVRAGRVAVPVPADEPAHDAPGPVAGPAPGSPGLPGSAAQVEAAESLGLPIELPLQAPTTPPRRGAHRPPEVPAPEVDAQDPALVLPTPQGPVVFTQGQLAAGLDALAGLLPVRPGRRHVTHVPDSPAGARAFTWHALVGGAEYCRLGGPHELLATAPRVLVACPEDFVAARDGLRPQVVGVRARAQRMAGAVGRARAAGRRVSALSRAGHGLLEATVLAPARAALGRPSVAICAGPTALPADVLDAYFAAGIVVYQAWTPPQAFGPLTANAPARVRFGTLGTAVATAAESVRLEPTEATGAGTATDAGTTGEATASRWVEASAPWLAAPARLPGRLDADGYLVPDSPGVEPGRPATRPAATGRG